jgi:glucose repression regulatory protein TUP1|eukprot:COSAG01_NODE_113_length_25617_cov_10.523492_17_plen_51_part_00
MDRSPVLTSKLKLQGHDNSVISVAHSATGQQFVTGSGDRQARMWRYEQKQ